MITPYPLKLIPVLKTPIWGGVNLLRHWGIQTDFPTVGEGWMLTLRKLEKNVIANGTWQGKTLDEVIRFYGASPEQFPILIKLLDAGDTLSIQVHPDDLYASEVENDRGKTEMWYILHAEPGAELIYGLKPGFSKEDFRKAVKDGNPDLALCHIPVKAGETYFIPAGMPHAIGKGILLAEIQQNCDLTYRIYDFNRRGPDGKLRELHVQKALDVVRPFTEEEIADIRFERLHSSPTKNLLADCRQFRVELFSPKESFSLPKSATYRHLLCIGGDGILLSEHQTDSLQKGDSYLLPANQKLTITGHPTFLLTEPHPNSL